MSLFSGVDLAPADPILGLTEAFQTDQRADKVNLGVGVYLDEQGKLPLLECIRAAGVQVATSPKPHGYLPITGLPEYNEAVRELVFGADAAAVANGRVATVQALGGTGALKVGADFLRDALPSARVLISDPSWENHRQIFARAGFKVSTYSYYDDEEKSIDFGGMLASLRRAPAGSVVVLHACCHNPTGYDLDPGQWQEVIDVLAECGHLPFVDMAYQGFADGIAEDGQLVRMLVDSGLEFVAATSFSKSLGLYGQRVGAFHIVASHRDAVERSLSQVKIRIRANYSNPTIHGAALAATVLNDPALRTLWETELGHMRRRIAALRTQLVESLTASGVTDMGFIAEQRGMFSYSGLTKEQMVRLREEHGVYGTDAGRICVAAINDGNMDKVVAAISAVH